MILSTTPTIEGHPIREYRGVVTGETIIGTNFVKDFFASVRDVIGGRSGSYESTLREAKDTALREMADRAASLGCNAIEKGDYNPTIRLCIAICRALDKTLDQLFWEEEET